VPVATPAADGGYSAPLPDAPPWSPPVRCDSSPPDATGTLAAMASDGVPGLLLRPQPWPLGGRLERITRFVTACAAEGSPPSCGDRHRVAARGTRSVYRAHLRGLPPDRATRFLGRPQKTYRDGTGLGRRLSPAASRLGFSESHLEYLLGLSRQLPLRVRSGFLRVTKNCSAAPPCHPRVHHALVPKIMAKVTPHYPPEHQLFHSPTHDSGFSNPE
jgi:hypothetical protein